MTRKLLFFLRVIAGMLVSCLVASGQASATARPAAAPSFELSSAAKPSYEAACSLVDGKETLAHSVPDGAGGPSNAYLAWVNCAIKATPAGATITLGTYILSNKMTARSLERAKKRGVKVIVVTQRETLGKYGKELMKTLGELKPGHKPQRSSYLLACNHSCYWSGKGGLVHIKWFTSSKLMGKNGWVNYVTLNGGGNIDTAYIRQWNAWEVFYSKAFHDAASAYAKGAWVDKTKTKFPVTKSGSKTMHFSPTKSSDVRASRIYKEIRDFKCSKTKDGDLIRVMMYIVAGKSGERFTSLLISKLRQGCEVGFIGSSMKSSKAQMNRLKVARATLTIEGKKVVRKIDFHDAYVKGRGNRPTVYLHIKAVSLMSGSKKLYYGSTKNFSVNNHNMEEEVFISDGAWVNRFNRLYGEVTASLKKFGR